MSELTQEVETSNSFLNDLLESIDEQEVQELGLDAADETYTIRDMSHANYAVKKLREVRNQIKEINETCDNQINSYKAKVDRYRESVTKPLINSEAYLLGLVQEYAKRELEGSSKKSIKLIEGTAQFRTPPAKFEYDEEVLLAFLQTDLPEFVKQTPSINKADLKKAGKVNQGTLLVGDKTIPGVTITPQDEKFEVK